jgi:hypothetical protein
MTTEELVYRVIRRIAVFNTPQAEAWVRNAIKAEVAALKKDNG